MVDRRAVGWANSKETEAKIDMINTNQLALIFLIIKHKEEKIKGLLLLLLLLLFCLLL